MKKITLVLSIGLSFLLTSCIKQLDKKFTGVTHVELDAAVLNSNATGVNYPILTRHARHGVPVATSDSTIRRISRTIQLRINLVGPQSSEDQTVGYKIFSSPISTISFPATALFTSAAGTSGRQEPARASGTLNVTDATAGTHFTALNGTVVIPAKTSFGYIEVQIRDAGSAAGQGRFLGIQLDSSGSIKPNPNYARIGLVIDQR